MKWPYTMRCDVVNDEMRTIAEIALEKGDPHLERAKDLFNTDTPTPEQRTRAKRWNYWRIYGGSPFEWF